MKKIIKKIGMIVWQIFFWGYVATLAIGVPVAILKFIFG